MSNGRPSILHVMIFVFLVALGFYALRMGSFPHLRAAYTATLVLLLGATVAARYRPGPEGGFWYGFAVFGFPLAS